MICLIIPFKLKDNDYINLHKKIFKEIFIKKKCTFLNHTKIIQLFKYIPYLFYKKIDIIFLNWHENILHQNSKNIFLFLFKIIKFFFLLFFYRIISKNVIYIKHNHFPHNSIDEYKYLIKKLINLAIFFSSLSVAHTSKYISNCDEFVHHPLYYQHFINDKKKKNVSLVFGRISPYKQIENLIKNWKIDSNLLIAGPSNDFAYLKFLRDISKNNIKINHKHYQEKEMTELLKMSKLLILPNYKTSSILSGVLYLALSLGCPVFAIQTPHMIWLKKEYKLIGLYLFKNYKSLILAIQEISNFNLPSNEQIFNNSKNIFGNYIVFEQWKSIFKKLSML